MIGVFAALAAFAIDQITKAIVVANAVTLSAGIPVFPGFNLVFYRNDGVTFGMLGGAPVERIQSVGNTALQGARKYLLSASERKRAVAIRKAANHVDLSTDPEFQMEFGMAMMFPEET